MYEFQGATPRIQALRKLIRERVIRTDAERAMIITESYRKNEQVVPIIKRPMGTYDVCSKMTIRVEPDELIVGNKSTTFMGACVYSEWFGGGWITAFSGDWELKEDGLLHNPPDEELRLTIHPDDLHTLQSISTYWRGKTVGATAEAWKPQEYDELARLLVSSYGNSMGIMGIPVGHLTPGFQSIINTGYGAIRKEAQDWIDIHRGNMMGEDMNKYMFYQSAVIACDAAITLTKRYGIECARQASECTNSKRKTELEMMADGLEWISEHPARTFWEACQSALMYQLYLALDSGYPALAFGRFDQYTWPFLEKDLKEGRLTMPQAQEIVDSFFLKANCFYNGAPGKLAQTTGIGNTYQHTTIGGVDPITGEDATNPVTYMVLETIGRLYLHDPTISLRIHRNTPDRLWDCALETAKMVGGLPLFQNDDVIVPGLMTELGFELKDARDYSIIGCQEIVGSGNDYPAPNGVHAPHASVHFGVILAMAINNGINPFNQEQASIQTGYLYEMKSFDEVKDAVEKMSRHILKSFVTMNNYAEYLTSWIAPHAGLSISMQGCMEKGMDATAGGCKYNSYGGTATGLATIADSLTTIKYMIFDKKMCTAKDLYDAVMSNWEGYEPLRQRILSQVPHFGNNDPYADEQMKWITDLYYQICSECYSTRSKVYKAGLYGASDHVAQGYHTWATPDGRKMGEPIADAASPAQGRDQYGPTAIFHSSVVYDNKKYMDGIALNLRMHPSALSREDGKEKLRDMTKTYFETGGMEVQYNIVSSDMLRAAQASPEEYRDLVVRIAGYSAYFVELNEDCQNDIIARNENNF